MSIDVRGARRWIALPMLVGVAVGAVTVVHARDASSSPTPGKDGREGVYASSVTERGPGASLEEASAEVASRLRSSGVESITRSANGSDGGVPALDIRVAGSGDTVRRVWLAGLAEGAVADSIRSSEKRVSQSVEGATLLSSEGGDPIDLGTAGVAGGQEFRSPTADVLDERVAAVARTFGLEVSDVTVVEPLEKAVQVTFVVPDTLTPTWVLSDVTAALQGDPMDVEGLYVALVDGAGTPLLTTAAAYRVGGGGLWFATGQDTRFGAVHAGGPVVASPTAP